MGERLSVWFEGPSKVSVRTEPIPRPKNNEYLVRSHLSTLSSGSERTLLKGKLDRSQCLDPLIAGKQTLEFPFPYGYQLVGSVVEQGCEVAEDLLGKRVFCFAPHSNYAVVNESCVYPLPQSVSDLQGSLLANMETALALVWDLNPFMCEKIGVFGQGIVGILSSLLLSRCGLSELMVFDPNPKKLDLATKIGVAEACGHVQKADILDGAVEVSSRARGLEHCIKATKPQGRIVIGSWYGDEDKPSLGTVFHRKRHQLFASQVSSDNKRLGPHLDKKRRMEEALKLLSLIPTDLFETQVFNMDQAHLAYSQLLNGDHDLLVFSYL